MMMMSAEVVYDYPTWLSGLAIVGLIVLAGMILQAVLHAMLPVAFRTQHNVSVTAIFSIIGVTYAVLLAFVAMLTWEGFNKARAATFDEAGAVAELRRLSLALPSGDGRYAAGIAERVRQNSGRGGMAGANARPRQRGCGTLAGRSASPDRRVPARHPGGNRGPRTVSRGAGNLSDARQGRLLAVEPIVPPLVWAVLLVGGGLLVLFSSLLGARSYALHLLMTAALSASGAMVIVLIVSLDNPFRSDFRISPDAFRMQSAQDGSP